jgi:hypothetical protein
MPPWENERRGTRKREKHTGKVTNLRADHGRNHTIEFGLGEVPVEQIEWNGNEEADNDRKRDNLDAKSERKHSKACGPTPYVLLGEYSCFAKAPHAIASLWIVVRLDKMLRTYGNVH